MTEVDQMDNNSGTVASPAWAESAFLKACRCEPTDYTPIWLMRQAGRYMKEYRDLRSRVSFLDLCQRPDLATEVMITAVERLGVDAAIIFSDILLILQPMGMDLEYVAETGPVLHNPVRTVDQAKDLQEVEPSESLNYVFEAVKATRAALPPHPASGPSTPTPAPPGSSCRRAAAELAALLDDAHRRHAGQGHRRRP